jgi:hypothetical protein
MLTILLKAIPQLPSALSLCGFSSLQAVGMFLGEFSCLAAFYLLQCRAARQSNTSVDPQQPFSTLLFLPPALCDMTGTSLMYVGE